MAMSSEAPPSPAPRKRNPEAGHDPYWWTPWAVLVGLVAYGVLGFTGVLSRPTDGPTAADVPAATPPEAKAASKGKAPTPRKADGDKKGKP